jgi:glycosyltransferase involved in cell wall biosynthesis
MHIAINCRSFSKKQFTGIGRYASSLVASLAEIDRANRYSLYTTRGYGEVKRRIHLSEAGNFFLRFDFFRKGVDKILPAVDIYHAPSPEVIEVSQARVIVTVHDLIYKAYPQSHTPETVDLTQRQFQSFVRRASKIICSSRNTQEDLHKYFTIDCEKTCHIHQGTDKNIFYPMDERQMRIAREAVRVKGIENPFVLFVGTIEPRKNLKGLIEAFAQLKEKRIFQGKLVVIGMAGWKSQGLTEYIVRLGLEKEIIFLGFVSSSDLRNFYNLAEVFVFPSFYEGFGYPIVEAFSCGAAVVTSNSSSCRELAAEAALLIDPSSIQEIVGAIRRILEDRNFKKDLQRRAIERAQSFDNLKMARETLKVYEEVYRL